MDTGYNPFPKKSFKPKPAGYYDCIFDEIEVFTRKRTEWEGNRPIPTNEDEDALRLKFVHIQEDGKAWTFRKEFSAAMGPRANIQKFANTLAGELLTPDIAKNREKFWAFLNALLSNDVTLRVGVSKDGNWNEVLDVLPKRDTTIVLRYDQPKKAANPPEQPESAADRAERKEAEAGKADFDDDDLDIPF